MSDSDDTDVLLLIPPDFFLADSESSEEVVADLKHKTNPSKLISPCLLNSLEIYDIERKQCKDQLEVDKYISPSKFRLDQQPFEMNFHSASAQIFHSTPKARPIDRFTLSDYGNQKQDFIQEIDNHLHNANGTAANGDVKKLAIETIRKHNSLLDNQRLDSHQNDGKFGHGSGIGDVYNKFGRLSDWRHEVNRNAELKKIQGANDTLISLNEIWDSSGKTENVTVHEERMRREHCEKTIQILQGKLTEYQQKIAVAIKVDKTKDEALKRLSETNSSLLAKNNHLELKITDIEIKMNDKDSQSLVLREKINYLEHEMTQYIEMAKKYQESCEKLEAAVDSLSRSGNEDRDTHRKQLQDLEIRLANSKRNENLLREDNRKLQVDFDKAVESLKASGTETQIDHLQEQLQRETSRADSLEKQKKSMQETITSLAEKEKNLLKELESQKSSLKSFYQNQLEDVVQQKVKEFQKQLDLVEDSFKVESKQRERLIAERAIKQMELFNQKNEEEISLINRKHNEEIEVYRIQLLNASRTISQLQTKRADIAERLHDVMETQWHRALEIISTGSPDDDASVNRQHSVKQNQRDGIRMGLCEKSENEMFETPMTSRQRKKSEDEQSSDDKLQSFIDLLLKKSPRGTEQLEEILNMPRRNHRKDTSHKPPWK